MKKALLIEDDDSICKLLEPEIRALGYIPVRAEDGQSGLELALEEDFEFILLDLQLPSLSGTDICKQIREKKNTPILMLTYKSDEVSKVLLLELGADDYITKPFSTPELMARIRAVLRRQSRLSNLEVKSIKLGELLIDIEKRVVHKAGSPIELTAREFDLLALMASQPGRPFTRDELNSDFYGTSVSGYERSVTNHISRIRSKLESDPERPIYLKTARGVGYYLADPETDLTEQAA